MRAATALSSLFPKNGRRTGGTRCPTRFLGAMRENVACFNLAAILFDKLNGAVDEFRWALSEDWTVRFNREHAIPFRFG